MALLRRPGARSAEVLLMATLLEVVLDPSSELAFQWYVPSALIGWR